MKDIFNFFWYLPITTIITLYFVSRTGFNMEGFKKEAELFQQAMNSDLILYWGVKCLNILIWGFIIYVSFY